MTDHRRVWDDVADSVSDLGRLLRERLAVERPPGTAEATAPPERDAVESARQALSALAEAAGRLGERAVDTVGDPEIRDGAQRVADRIGAALSAGLGEIDAEVRTYVQARRHQREQRDGGWDDAVDDPGSR